MQLSAVCLSVRLSVCPILPLLLLWARRSGDIDRLLHGRRSAAGAPQHGTYAGSATLSADVGS